MLERARSKYIVDINKPPMRPPGRMVHEQHGETLESKADGIVWNEYIKQYGEEMDKSK